MILYTPQLYVVVGSSVHITIISACKIEKSSAESIAELPEQRRTVVSPSKCLTGPQLPVMCRHLAPSQSVFEEKIL